MKLIQSLNASVNSERQPLVQMSGPQLCSKQVRTLNEIAFQIWALST
ncbi:hypothetical protein OIU79_021692, partial [Salix purpurea]